MKYEIGINLKCPTCGTALELVLFGKLNSVYVARCPNVTIKHPTWICIPTAFINNEKEGNDK